MPTLTLVITYIYIYILTTISDQHDVRRSSYHDAVLQPRRVPSERGVDHVVGMGRVLGRVRPREKREEQGMQACQGHQVNIIIL